MVPAPLQALSHSIVFGMPPSVLLFSSGALLLAGFIKGGSAAWSAGNRDRPLTMVMTPGQAALLVVQKAATNIWQALTDKHLHPLRRRFWPMLLGVGSTPGTGFLVHDSSGRATVALGTAGLGALLRQWLRRRDSSAIFVRFFLLGCAQLAASGRQKPDMNVNLRTGLSCFMPWHCAAKRRKAVAQFSCEI